jgi:hypothetical protein
MGQDANTQGQDALSQTLIKLSFAFAFLVGLLWLLLFSGYAHASGCSAGNPGSPQTILTYSSGDVAAATATATMPAPATAQAWNVTELNIWGNSATATSNVVCTITGLQGGTVTLDVNVGAIGTNTQNPVQKVFTCPKTGVAGTAVVFSCPSMGSGATHTAIDIAGFVQ